MGTADLSKILGESSSCNSKESSKNPENSDKKDSTSKDKTGEKSNSKRKESIISENLGFVDSNVIVTLYSIIIF